MVITYTFLFAYVAKNVHENVMAANIIQPTRLQSPASV